MKRLFLSTILAFLLLSVSGEVRLPRIFGSHMVLQREQPVQIWGWADAHEKVSVMFNDQMHSTQADEYGEWSMRLEPMPAGGPSNLIVQGSNEIVLTDVLIGDVWICSGQSNMEWPMSKTLNADEEINNADYPFIRTFNVPNEIGFVESEDLSGGLWQVCSPATIPEFSAVGYFFGRTVHRELGIPIGLIGSNWGGTRIETWMSKEAMVADPALFEEFLEKEAIDYDSLSHEMFERIMHIKEHHGNKGSGYRDGEPVWADPQLDISDWDMMELPCRWEDGPLFGVDGVVWFRLDIFLSDKEARNDATLYLGPIDDDDRTWVNGVLVGETIQKSSTPRIYSLRSDILKPGMNSLVVRVKDTGGAGGIYGKPGMMRLETSENLMKLSGAWYYRVSDEDFKLNPGVMHPNQYPTLLYNGMIHPLTPLPAKGVIWYQGEANTSNAAEYRQRFPAMIEDWRRAWHNPELGFYFVQLANYMAPDEQPSESSWAELREAQQEALKLPITGMAVAIDIGEADDIHPRNKQDVGYRLALSALHSSYGKDIVYSGPMFKSLLIEGAAMFVEFDHTGTGLIVEDKYGFVNGFAIAGKDGIFQWAKAWIVDKNKVMVFNENIPEPVSIRYGWGNNPDDLNLYNSDGLPASPFRAEGR